MPARTVEADVEVRQEPPTLRPTTRLARAVGTALLTRVVGTVVLVVGLLTSAAALAAAPTHVPGGSAASAAAPGRQGSGGQGSGGQGSGGQARGDIEQYVALGDSYTAGPLIPQTTLAFGCFRSTRNYPAMLAAALHVRRFVDVSCSGADTTALTSPQHTGLGALPPQLSALSPDTDLVTVGIGGNDFGVFRRLVSTCPAVRSQDPDGDPCREHFRAEGRDALLRAVGRTRDRLVAAVAEIRRRAPQAAVVVVGYPRIAPAHGTCPSVLPFADGDYRYADQVERRLNAALRYAARVNGAAYVDTYRASRGHHACAGEDAWVDGARTDPRRAQSYHPVRAYMRAVADLVPAEISRADPS